MKRFFMTVALLAAVAFSANSQIRVEGIGNLSNLKFIDGSLETKTKAEFGFGVRALYTIAETDDAGFDLGLGYMFTKSTNNDSKTVAGDADAGTISLNSIQLPFHAYYLWQFGNCSLSGNVGFYGAYALSGKTTLGVGGLKVETDPFEGEAGMKRFDFGSDDEILFSCGNITLGVGFQYSFLNLCKMKDVKINSENIYFAIGYKF